MQNLEKKIKNNLNLIKQQYLLKGNLKVYISTLEEIEKKFFSNNLISQQEALEGFKSLLLSYRAWEDAYSDYFSDTGDKYKDKFVDGFNNWDEWYSFLENLVKDVEEYYKDKKDDKNSRLLA